MEFEKQLQIGNIDYIKRMLFRIFDEKKIKQDNFLDKLVASGVTWHCGGMSDPFQPIEDKLKVTEQLIEATKPYGIHILFSTKADTVYGCNLDNKLHTFQMSVTNLNDRRDIEPNIPSIKNRIDFYNNLKSDGFKVGIRVQPFIPNITTPDIVTTFKDADYFTIEGLKLVPQNKEHKDYLINLLNLDIKDFKQMGLLNLKPEIREVLYKDFVDRLEKYKIPYSIADNDMHYISSGKCCCGDTLVHKSTDFNNTAMCFNNNTYTIDDIYKSLGDFANCKCNQLFTSNRQEGCTTVGEFYEKRFDRASSPFSPKFMCNYNDTTK